MRFHTAFAGGSGANVTDAIAAEVADGYKKALVDWKLLYTASSMTNPAIQRSKGSKQLVDAWQQAIKGSMARHGNELETLMFGAGYGILGRRASASTNVITLTNPGEAFNFQEGQVVGASPNADGSSPRTGTTAIASLDRSNNKLTLVSAAGITAFADNDYFFVKGLVGTTAVPGGLARIIPPVAPTAGDNFGGLDRSIAPEALAGWRYTGIAGEQVTEQLIKGLQHGSKFDGKADTVVISVDKMTTFILEQANRVEFTEMKSEKYNVSFRGVTLQGPHGPVTVMSSPKCPDANGWALERETWKLESVQEPLIAVATRTGKYIDSELNDLVRLRWRSQFQLECSLPGHNGVFNFV
jgi:hypothetical protein